MDWSKSHCGIFHAPFYEVKALMPEVWPILRSATTEYPFERYTVDVKVHMLMPGQYPCIPNWHYDMVPRVEGKQDFSSMNTDLMYMWISGKPTTEFEDSAVTPMEWFTFSQRYKHRGTAAKQHTWRCLIRLCPDTILKPAPKEMWLRRHSQVYLDAKEFAW